MNELIERLFERVTIDFAFEEPLYSTTSIRIQHHHDMLFEVAEAMDEKDIMNRVLEDTRFANKLVAVVSASKS